MNIAVQIVKRFSLPLGLLLVLISVIVNFLSLNYPWSRRSGVLVHPSSDASLQVMIITSSLVTLISFYLYFKRIEPTVPIIVSLIIDTLCSVHTTFSVNARVYTGYFLSLLSSIMKGTASILLTLKIGLLEIEIVKEEEVNNQ